MDASWVEVRTPEFGSIWRLVQLRELYRKLERDPKMEGSEIPAAANADSVLPP